MLEQLLILDGNHLAYRAYYKFNKLKTLEGKNTSIIYGMTYIIESLIRRFGPNKVIIAFDGGSHKYRKDLLPDYKQREKKLGFNAEDFYHQRDVSIDMLKSLGLPIVYKRGFEADDLITQLVKRFKRLGWDIVIITGDKDFNQLIDENVSIYNVTRNKLLTNLNLKLIVGYEPNQTVDFLCLAGDSSDHIKGYHGIGEKKALNLLNEFKSIKNFLTKKEKMGKINPDALLEVYRFNKKLIDLRHFYRKFLLKEPIPYLIDKPEFDLDTFKNICGDHETSSFLKPQFINTFKDLYNGK